MFCWKVPSWRSWPVGCWSWKCAPSGRSTRTIWPTIFAATPTSSSNLTNLTSRSRRHLAARRLSTVNSGPTREPWNWHWMPPSLTPRSPQSGESTCTIQAESLLLHLPLVWDTTVVCWWSPRVESAVQMPDHPEKPNDNGTSGDVAVCCICNFCLGSRPTNTWNLGGTSSSLVYDTTTKKWDPTHCEDTFHYDIVYTIVLASCHIFIWIDFAQCPLHWVHCVLHSRRIVTETGTVTRCVDTWFIILTVTEKGRGQAG